MLEKCRFNEDPSKRIVAGDCCLLHLFVEDEDCFQFSPVNTSINMCLYKLLRLVFGHTLPRADSVHQHHVIRRKHDAK